MVEDQWREDPALALDPINSFLEFSKVLRDCFDGDFEVGLIMLTISARSLRRREMHHLSDKQAGNEDYTPATCTNIRSVSASTNIPLETVRRKINKLLALGWIRRQGNLLCVTEKALQELWPIRRALLHWVISASSTVKKMERLEA